MLKKLIVGGIGIMVVMWLTGTASALVFTDIVDPNPDVLIHKGDKVETYSHDLILTGFDPLNPLHMLSSVELTLDLVDDEPNDKTERVEVEVDGVVLGAFQVTGSELNLNVNVSLVQSDGKAVVTLIRDKGDFLWRSSTLVADTSHTPEPSTLMLLGSGLVGVAGMGFRRRKQTELSNALVDDLSTTAGE